MTKILNKFREKKQKVKNVIDLKPFGENLFYVHGGLDDYVIFLDLFSVFKKTYPNIIFKSSFYRNIDFSCLTKDFFLMKTRKPTNIDRIKQFEGSFNDKFYNSFHHIFCVNETEEFLNPEKCATDELGITYDDRYSYKFDIPLDNEFSDLVGFNFCSNDDRYKDNSINFNDANKIWIDIFNLGFIPLDLYCDIKKTPDAKIKPMGVTVNIDESTKTILRRYNKYDNYYLKRSDYSIKFSDFLNRIRKIKYFIGIESEIFYLVSKIIGKENCILISNSTPRNHVLRSFKKISNYNEDELKHAFHDIKRKEMETLLKNLG